jgi:DNA-binding LacI/PurR family transcriptional regulator
MERSGTGKGIKPRVSSFDVARLAGVSRSAVSRSFTRGASVSEETRAKVISAARELGYHPNAIARTLSTKRSNIVAVVVADLENPFYATAVSHMSAALQREGYTMLLLVAESSHAIDSLIPRLLSYQTDGIVVASAMLSSSVAEYCVAAGMPLLQFNRYTAFAGASTVQSDNLSGGAMAAELLVATGHRRIAFMAGLEDASSSVDRARGLAAGLASHGASIWARDSGGYTYAGGYAAAHRLLSGPERPDAIFCANDVMALGVVDAAAGLGMKVPEALSVIGFDNIPLAGSAHYALTTIDQNVSVMATEAVTMMLAAIRQQLDPPLIRTIPCNLVSRNSVRNATA